MIKKYLVSSLVLFLIFAAWPVLANNGSSQSLPETDGTYDVPGHSNLKLRVIVHHSKPAEKPGKPGPAPSPTLKCGLPDPDSSATVSATKWRMPSQWTYRVNPWSVPSNSNMKMDDIYTIAANAFSSWDTAVNGKVTISKIEDTTINRAARDGQNIITWGRTSPSALGITYIWYDTSTKPYTVVELDTILNSRFAWAWSSPETWKDQQGYLPDTTCAYQGVYDAQDILTHELGHWYGLDDEYDAVNYAYATMFGYGYTGQTNADTLTIGDIAGVQSIYSK